MKLKAIFHVDEMPKWGLALKNVKNLVQTAEPNSYLIEVLANSEAVKGYCEESFNDNLALMRQLPGLGVRFVACNNALKSLGIEQSRLAPFVTVVQAGVLELVEKQAEGFAYIKP